MAFGAWHNFAYKIFFVKGTTVGGSLPWLAPFRGSAPPSLRAQTGPSRCHQTRPWLQVGRELTTMLILLKKKLTFQIFRSAPEDGCGNRLGFEADNNSRWALKGSGFTVQNCNKKSQDWVWKISSWGKNFVTEIFTYLD